MNRIIPLFALLLLPFSCSAPEVKEEPSPIVEEEPEAPPPPADPFLKKLARFEAAYKEMVCRANRDFDPTSNIGMLKEPYAELVRLTAEGSKTLEVYETILKRHGYASVQELFEDRERIDIAEPNWFSGLTERLFDIVEECGSL